MRIRIDIIIYILLNTGLLYSQNSISGGIISNSAKALPFANIVLYNTDTDKVVTGAVSDDNGPYSFIDIQNGNYALEISVLGFKTLKSDSFTLSEQNQKATYHFTSEEEAQALDEVVVKSNRPIIRQSAEKLIINLEQSEMVRSNLQDVMKKVPGIINENITNGGQQGITT